MSAPRVEVSQEEDRRQLAGKVVNALYRVIKACQLHSEQNQAVIQVIDHAVVSVQRYCETAGVKAAAILFTPHAVFINRQMMRASKETYQLALELGTLLAACDATEVTVSTEITATEVAEFGRAAANASRDGKPSVKLTNGGWDGLRLRKIVGLGTAGILSPQVKAARTYAAGLMILKAFYSDLREGNYEPRQGVKRIAQKLVSQSDLEARLLLSIAAVPSVDADRTQTLLSSAVVALAMASQLSTDRSLLSAIVSSALLYDIGRPRLVGIGASTPRQLNADEESLQMTSVLVAATALGKLHPPNLTRAVLLHEVHALKNGVTPYRGKRTPTLASRILVVARSFVELRTPSATSSALGLDDAIQVLDGQAADNTGRALVKLLLGALGIFPAGTMVELSTGEMGVVLATPNLPVDFSRPPVRILYDENAQLLPEPEDVDLSVAVTKDGRVRTIRKAIDSTDQQMRQMRAYVMQVASRRSRQASDEAPVSNSREIPSDVSSSFGSSALSRPSLPGELSSPSAGQAISAVKLPVEAPKIKHPTRRWDPRSEEAGAGAPAQGKQASSQRAEPPAETRSVSWGEIGKEIENARKLPGDSETDSILAAYLSDDANRSSQGAEALSSPSWGLRWTSSGKSASFDAEGPPSNAGSQASAPVSQPVFPESKGGDDDWDEVFPAQPAARSGRPTPAPQANPPAEATHAAAEPPPNPPVKTPLALRMPPGARPPLKATVRAMPAVSALRDAPTPPVASSRATAALGTTSPVEGATSATATPSPSPAAAVTPSPSAAAASGAAPNLSLAPRSVRAKTTSSWASPPKSRQPDSAPIAEQPAAPLEEPVVEVPVSSGDPARDRRAKAGTAAWANPRRDQKK
jgi:HD-GYP domain-containing protein (c-di-GMP phosphodiesterase class II)